MPTLDSRWLVCRDGDGRVEITTHPEHGRRVWACSGCFTAGTGEDKAREHAARCDTRSPLRDHFIL
ncbi:hypothetical protein H181DRAFT_03150 [Streptomyces sp. WMMB 714]|uniref:hypothetical protein n=1 Tax=Streptomyces sp. WMMB 714 TaxID=1286822 RepID=UPI0005F7BF86|nr:hypothetical protein [Streptomyces sp. WMMB 714]SCK37250.1 hypothetical protein H181DRAFT_03150 [Streptomyces sp. WMMB 714]